MNAFRDTVLQIFVVTAALLLTACGGGSSAGSSSSSAASSSSSSTPDAPTVTVSYGPKQIILTWAAVSDATYYQVSKNATGTSGYSSLGDSLTTTTYTDTVAVHLTDWINASYKVSACNTQGCTDSAAIYAVSTQSIGYFKASNTDASDHFGYAAVALSSDGTTLAVGARGEDSNVTSVSGDQTNNDASGSGAVYVFTRTVPRTGGAIWSQQAYLKASNPDTGDYFGDAVALSSDGNTLAVGAFYEDSNATGVGGDQANDDASGSGAVYVFTRSTLVTSTWSQQAYLKASNPEEVDMFGYAVALSSDGTTLAVGAYGEDSNATGVGGNQTNNDASDSGAVYVFTRSDATWSQQVYLKASNPDADDQFGCALALSSTGNTLAVGASYEASNATGDGGDQTNNDAPGSGAVYVFTRTAPRTGGGTWSQQAYLKASNPDTGDYFGDAVALSSDGNTLAVGARYEASNATGDGGDQTNNDASRSGAVYVFTRSDATWSQQAYLKASNTDANDYFGLAVALSSDGNILAVGAFLEDSNATGVGGDQTNNDASGSGAVYVFTRSDLSTWSQQAYLKASNTDAYDYFGAAVALSSDGTTLAVGAYGEDSNATGDGGDQTINDALESGAVYLY